MHRYFLASIAIAVVTSQLWAFDEIGEKQAIFRGQADVATAQADRDAASNRCTSITQRDRAVFEASDAFIAKTKACQDATTAVKTEHDKVITDLAQQPDYIAACDARGNSKKAVDDARANGADMATVMDLAQTAMTAGAAVTNMEKKALDADTEYAADKKSLADANAAMSLLEKQYKAKLLADPDYQTAMNGLDTANGEFAAANTELENAQNTYAYDHPGGHGSLSSMRNGTAGGQGGQGGQNGQR